MDLADFVPADATAIAYNLTIVRTQSAGFLFVGPGDAAGIAASTINWWQSDLILANGTTVSLDSSRQVKVFAAGGGGTHFIIDAVAYDVPI